MLRSLRSWSPAFALFAALSLTGCPAPEPPTAPVAPPKSEEAARSALERAKKKDDAEALLAVYHEFKEYPSGTKALNLGVRKLFESAIESANKCDELAAKTLMARANPYALDFPAINEAYDETYESVNREKRRCNIIRLDADLKKAEEELDWPRAFNRVGTEKEVDGAVLAKRRVDLTNHFTAWLDDSIKKILAQKSFAKVVGDKRDKFDAALDSSQYPPEVGDEVKKRAGAFEGLRVVFDKLEDGAVIDPAGKYWTFGTAKAHTPASLTSDPLMLPNGLPFFAIAKGKLGGESVLVAGPGVGTLLERLAAIKLVIPENAARTYNTSTALPEQLVGERVLAPISAGSETLGVATVISDDGKVIVVAGIPGGGRKTAGPSVKTKRAELRGFALEPGKKVTVYASGTWKPGEVVDVTDAEHILVRINGFEVPFSSGDLRIKRGELPAPPAE